MALFCNSAKSTMTHRAKSNQQRGLSGLGVLACKFIPNSFTIKNMRNTQNENRMLPFLFMAAFLLAAASIRAGTITLVNLPATGTDAATGISTANTYVCCLAFGSSANVTINSVPFQQVKPGGVAPPVSGTDSTHGGTYTLNANHNLNSTSNGNAPSQANGSTETMLVDVIFVQSSAPVGSDLDQTYGGLTVGAQYALRLYYRQWSSPDNRQIYVWFNGEGTNQQYLNAATTNMLNESAGGAHYLEYDFTAASSSVNVYMTNLVANESVMVSGMSLQQTGAPPAPVAPTITEQPVGLTNYAGQRVSLSVGASGYPPPAYQWYQNGLPLSGATNYLIATSDLDATNAGSYDVIITNVAGAVTSSVVSVAVLSPITEEPGSVTVTNGQNATFWVNAVGATHYQWYSNSVLITGAATAVYTISNLTLAANNSIYSVTVTTPDGPTNSTTATLTVEPATAPPTVFSASQSANATATNIVVVYSEAVSAATALNAANYSLNGVTPLSAVAGSQPNVVILTTATALSTNTAYFLAVQNVQDLFANTIVTGKHSGSAVPTCRFGSEPMSGVVTDVNGNVVQWLDQTANDNNATQYSGGPTERPTPQANQMNGEPALLASIRRTATISKSPRRPASPSPGTCPFMPWQHCWRVFFRSLRNRWQDEERHIRRRMTTTTARRRAFSGNRHFVLRVITPPRGLASVFRTCLSLTMQGPTSVSFLDGQPNGSNWNGGNLAARPTPSPIPAPGLRIGSRNDLAQFMNGEIAEVMIFSNALSSTDRTNIDNYLGAKYFPFTITQQPAPVTTNEGGTATFSVAASQGSAHLNYQWQEGTTNNPTPTNIANATNASYTTGRPLPGDNGDTFDVQITSFPVFPQITQITATRRR
jgi:hypothetical protein